MSRTIIPPIQDQRIRTLQDQNGLIQYLLPPQQTIDWNMAHGGRDSSRERSRQSFICAASKDPWTEQEEFKMIVAHRKYKNKWSEMTENLKGRNNNTIKNKFYSVFRKIKGKIQKEDYSYESKLELLETYYIISLMEYHLEHPTQYPKAKGKRGKDFIYSLIHNLTQEMVQNYKEKIQQLAMHEGNMKDLINELTIIYQGSGDGLTTKYHTPAKNNSTDEDKMRNGPGETLTVLETPNNLCNLEMDEFLNAPFKISNPENSPIIESGRSSPALLFSPPPLSAGPAAAAAGASRAACFGGFSDISSMAKALTEERLAKVPPMSKETSTLSKALDEQ